MPLIRWKLYTCFLAYSVVNICHTVTNSRCWLLSAENECYLHLINNFTFRCKYNKFISFSAKNMLKTWLKAFNKRVDIPCLTGVLWFVLIIHGLSTRLSTWLYTLLSTIIWRELDKLFNKIKTILSYEYSMNALWMDVLWMDAPQRGNKHIARGRAKRHPGIYIQLHIFALLVPESLPNGAIP